MRRPGNIVAMQCAKRDDIIVRGIGVGGRGALHAGCRAGVSDVPSERHREN